MAYRCRPIWGSGKMSGGFSGARAVRLGRMRRCLAALQRIQGIRRENLSLCFFCGRKGRDAGRAAAGSGRAAGLGGSVGESQRLGEPRDLQVDETFRRVEPLFGDGAALDGADAHLPGVGDLPRRPAGGVAPPNGPPSPRAATRRALVFERLWSGNQGRRPRSP